MKLFTTSQNTERDLYMMRGTAKNTPPNNAGGINRNYAMLHQMAWSLSISSHALSRTLRPCSTEATVDAPVFVHEAQDMRAHYAPLLLVASRAAPPWCWWGTLISLSWTFVCPCLPTQPSWNRPSTGPARANPMSLHPAAIPSPSQPSWNRPSTGPVRAHPLSLHPAAVPSPHGTNGRVCQSTRG